MHLITLSHKPADCVSAPTVTVFVHLGHAGTASAMEALLHRATSLSA